MRAWPRWLSSVIAVLWNIGFNFQLLSAGSPARRCGAQRQAPHCPRHWVRRGLVFTLVPLFAWWFNVSLWQAFVMDLALIVFFLCYTFVFNCV